MVELDVALQMYGAILPLLALPNDIALSRMDWKL